MGEGKGKGREGNGRGGVKMGFRDGKRASRKTSLN
jgi:hypothetical protein